MDGEILPPFQKIMGLVQTLRLDSPPDDVQQVLKAIAEAKFSKFEDERLLAQMQVQTGGGSRALSGDLKTWKLHLKKEAPSESTEVKETTGKNAWFFAIQRDDERKEPLKIMANVVAVATLHHDWLDVLALDEFTGFVMVMIAPPWASDDERRYGTYPRPLTDADIRAATHWLQTNTGIYVQSHIVLEGLQHAAERKRFHPVQDYLGECGKKWDDANEHSKREIPSGIDRLFLDYFGANETIDYTDERQATRYERYYKAISAKAMIGAVARIFDPGCKNDTMPNLKGPQAKRKSTAVETLFTPWFTDDLAEMGSKDSQVQIAGIWGVEVGEMVAARNVERTKQFLSRKIDRYRAPYGKLVTVQPRQTVFWGTTNKDVFLYDTSGNRRSWGVHCGDIDLESLKEDRDLLWGEAVIRYLAGESWWIEEQALVEIAAEVQHDFTEENVWHNLIAEYITESDGYGGKKDKEKVSVSDILINCIGFKNQELKQEHMNVVAGVLQELGWERKQKWISGKRHWFYLPPMEPEFSPVTDADKAPEPPGEPYEPGQDG